MSRALVVRRTVPIILYSCEHVNLNGKNDVSVKLKFAKGNYTDAAISLFTYYRGPRRMKFRDFR